MERICHDLRYYLTAFCLLPFFISCGDDEEEVPPAPEPPAPEVPTQGGLLVTADWSDRSEDAVLPESYVLCLDGISRTVKDAVYEYPDLLDPGKHPLLAYNVPEGITVSGTTATVRTEEDGRLDALPGYLFSASTEVAVTAGDTLHATLRMKQRVRRLVLNLKLGQGDAGRILRTSSTLTGIASAFSLENGTVLSTGSGTLSPVFTVVRDDESRAAGDACLYAVVRILGAVPGQKQTLALTLDLSDTSSTQVETDLTELLTDFAEDTAPVVLEAALTLPEVPDAGGVFHATISGWSRTDEYIDMEHANL